MGRTVSSQLALAEALMLCVLAMTVAGCADDSRQTEPHPSVKGANQEISFSSPAVTPSGRIGDGLTCDQKESWIPLRWGKIPASTAELALYVGRFENRKGRSPGLHIPAGSLIWGINPQRHKLNAGRYPAETAVARFRPKHLCPPHGGHFTFQLFALSNRQRVEPRTIGIHTLTELTLNSLAIGRFTAVDRPSIPLG